MTVGVTVDMTVGVIVGVNDGLDRVCCGASELRHRDGDIPPDHIPHPPPEVVGIGDLGVGAEGGFGWVV